MRWPRRILNAAYHSGLLILIGESGPSLWHFDWATEIPVQIPFIPEGFRGTVDAVAINVEYYCFAVDHQVWAFSRKSHSAIAVFTGMRGIAVKGIAVDVTFSGNYILALTREEGVYQWDLRTKPPFGSLCVPHMRHVPRHRWNGLHGEFEDMLGWCRRARLLCSINASNLVLERYREHEWYDSSFKEIPTKWIDTMSMPLDEITQMDMFGEFIIRTSVEHNPSFLIQDPRTGDIIKEAIHLPNHPSALGDFIGVTLNPRAIICFYTSGIYVISMSISKKEETLLDDLFLHASSSRMLRVKTRDWPERRIGF
jgi:hypothetical protein